MNTTIIPKFIVNLFKNEIQKIHKMLLYEISKDYNINLDELEKKYICDININNDKIQIIKKRSYNANLPEEKRCVAYNAKNERCQRSKGSHDKYCPIHLRSLRYGTKIETEKTTTEKKWSKLY